MCNLPVTLSPALKHVPGVQGSPDYYAEALRSLQAGDFPAAERLFEKTIETNPQGPHAADARRHLGQLYTAAPSGAVPLSTSDGLIESPLPPLQPTLPRPPGSASADDGPNELSHNAAAGPESGSDADRFLIEAGDRVFFSAGSAELGGRARTVLSAQAKWLATRPEWNVSVEGHADDPPLSQADMEELSEARATAVRERLIAEGVAAARIVVVPWGHQLPISDCQETGCQAQNRRVISVLMPRRGFGQQNSQKRPADRAPLTASRSGTAAQ
jgi:outer membrane protein OmpA-like peptidoglycan-associated protein